jgi:hypothetical protein
MSLLDDVVAATPCSVELPAGAGKTETIPTLVHQFSLLNGRVLVLTHTRAGVDALRRKFKKRGVSRSSYSVQT